MPHGDGDDDGDGDPPCDGEEKTKSEFPGFLSSRTKPLHSFRQNIPISQ